MNRYGSNPGVIGRTVRINDIPTTIIGVMPEGIQVSVQHRHLDAAQRRSPSLEEQKRNSRPLQTFGHLAPGVTREQAQSELINISKKIESENPDTNKDIQARVQTFNEQPERRTDPHGVPVADGRRRVRAADCVRERRQPAAVAGHQPGAGDFGARVARRVALARRPAAADGERAAVDRSAASAASASRRSASGCSIAPRSDVGPAVLDPVHDGRQRHRVLRAGLPRHRHHLRPRAGPARRRRPT